MSREDFEGALGVFFWVSMSAGFGSWMDSFGAGWFMAGMIYMASEITSEVTKALKERAK